MRLPPWSLASRARRLGRWLRAVVVALARAAATALRRGAGSSDRDANEPSRLTVGGRARRLGRRLRAVVAGLAGAAAAALGIGRGSSDSDANEPSRLTVGGLARRLGRWQRAAVVALAGAATALGIGAGSSDRDAKDPSRAAAGGEAADVGPGAPAIAAARRAAERRGRSPRRGGAEHYRRTATRRVTAKGARAFLPLYREAERSWGVNWRLIASIHRQETAFSTSPSTYHGLNDFGCCAGPMQFNVTNGPVSTWETYRNAYRQGRRPKHYPHRTRSHPSIYDDFDAIMAAGSLLSESGADRSLDAGSWSAAYAYYGHDLFGVTYASQVLARAVAWERDGFCPNCAVDEVLVAEFDDTYGESERRELLAAERRKKKDKPDRDRGRDRHGRGKAGDDGDRRRSRARKRRSTPPSAKKDRRGKPSPPRRRRGRTGPIEPSPPPATQTQPSPSPPTTAPAPPPCSLVHKLLGCRR